MPEPEPIPAIQTPWGPLTPTDGTAAGGGEPAPVAVPDHMLLRRIGRGAYGEVWLARNALGLYRAVKVLHRSSFGDDRPFEREFAGIQRFEPVSRSHESQLNILHVGRTADHFYYVMELADDQGHGAAIAEASYTPRTLRSELLFRGRLPVDECLRLGLALTTALGHLHRHGLVHRDIKPSNIVFVNGIPKLADIGLVAQAERTMSFVGTRKATCRRRDRAPSRPISSAWARCFTRSAPGTTASSSPNCRPTCWSCPTAPPLPSSTRCSSAPVRPTSSSATRPRRRCTRTSRCSRAAAQWRVHARSSGGSGSSPGPVRW